MRILQLFAKPSAKRLIYGFIALYVGCFFGWGYYDRDKPLTLLGMASPTIPVGRFDDEITFDYYVERHLDRKCSMSLQRYTIDSTHTKRRYTEDDDFVSAEGREERERSFPGRLRIPFSVPRRLAPGPAELLTEIQWRCPYNLTTFIVPIWQSYSWPFEVLPPVGKPLAPP